MGTKLNDPCIIAAEDDEPLFVLRANDELAPDVVRYWAGLYGNKHVTAGTLTPARHAKLLEATDQARRMEEWKRNGLDK